MKKYLFGYIIIVNIISFALMGIDKQKARKKQWRISENTLLLSAAVLGAGGSLLGMTFFRHKTKHLKFQILVPLFLIIQLAGLVYFLK